jgi:hypothetical protein
MARFQKGVSGNPGGRKPQSVTEKRFRDQIRQAVPEVIATLIEQAKAGDATASRLLLERAVSPLRPTDLPAPIAIPRDLAGASTAVLTALGAGELTPGQAAQYAATISSLAKTNELVAIETRLAAIEAMLYERSTR